ncbi:hypothetical protein NLN92_14320 [Citrobacter portucalensis]|uniref:hypothetical protein n=1 Tax=Citrobacter portucalensis TaxID=1639133 RepID=UPI00226B069D|nr:hypothetical protein [Citrobacter portucalensis]MCX8979184.1 hypothetical protein [Citrobacter portucalensis]
MSSIVTASRGTETVVVEFDGFDVDEEVTFTCTGDKDTAGLLTWLNRLSTLYGSNDGIDGLYTDTEKPRAIIKAFRLTGYTITLPEIWEGMDDKGDDIPGANDLPSGDVY